MEKMLLPYVRYFEFGGRSTRTEYWLFNLFWFSVIIVILIGSGGLDWLLFGTPDHALDFEALGLGMTLLIGFGVISFIPMAAVTVRRFHDVGLSGWIAAGLLFACFFEPLDIIANIVMFVIALLPSDANDNQWGDNPHGTGTDYRDGLREEYRSGKGVRYR